MHFIADRLARARVQQLRMILVVLGLWWVGAGCNTISPSGASVTAYVTVEGSTPAQILTAANAAFQAHGFRVGSAPGYSLLFEKEAGTVSNLMYGGWEPTGVWLRAKVKVAAVGKDRYAIDCVAVYVRNRGETGVEEEQPGPSSAQFKDILKEIKAKLALTAQAPQF
jgi:hypothetical protein